MSKKSVLIAGGTGLVGSRIVALLDRDKYDVSILSRSRKEDTNGIDYKVWDLKAMSIEKGATDVDAIINLTGAGIADERWTDDRKKVIINSRVDAAKLLQKGIIQDGSTPRAYIAASAIGYYGNRQDELITEESKPGSGFLAETCVQWEEASQLMVNHVQRVVLQRIGIVLSKQGGALPKILMTKAIGIYNYFGNGQQYYAWIHIDDLARMFIAAIDDESIVGPYNAVAPEPLTNKAFTIEIKDALGGLAALPAPAFGLRLALGEMADVVLHGSRVIPARYLDAGFSYGHPDLGGAVKDIVSRGV